jgi:hypothetical protein
MIFDLHDQMLGYNQIYQCNVTIATELLDR